MKTEILIAHPYKHHALHLAAGCVRSGHSALAVLPLYRKGIGKLVALAPGRVGAKAKGYFHQGLPGSAVYSSAAWQLRRLFVYSGQSAQPQFVRHFDAFVAQQLRGKTWRPRVVVTLQDYMPRTMRAAREAGLVTVTDQILNQSDSAMHRISSHYLGLGLVPPETHDESANREILAGADYVTYPSSYCMSGGRNEVSNSCKLRLLPYGVDTRSFSSPTRARNDKVVTVVARANSIRKGGHLLIKALSSQRQAFREVLGRRRLKVIFLGQLQRELTSLARRLPFHDQVEILARDFAHREVPGLLASSDLFVMPSLSEGMSFAALEAMQSGLPSILTPYCGIDIAEDGVTGTIVDDSVKSLGSGLIHAIRHQHMWDSWGGEARSRVAKLSWDHYESGIASTYSAILGR